jgi:hypothetical protein
MLEVSFVAPVLASSTKHTGFSLYVCLDHSWWRHAYSDGDEVGSINKESSGRLRLVASQQKVSLHNAPR